MVMFDNYAVKQRISDIITNDKTIYNPKSTPGKLVNVYIGFPKNKNIYAVDTPYLVITNAVKFIPKVTQAGGIVNNAYSVKEYDVQYNLIVVDKQEDGQTVEKSLDAILLGLINTLDGNFTLRKSDGSDAKVKMSLVNAVQMLGAGQNQGKATDGFEMTLACKIFTGTS